MATIGQQSSLARDLSDLAVALGSLDIPEGQAAGDALSASRDRLIRSIRTYSIPRLTGEQEPLLVVFAGPTGSGKSTLVNSLAGLELSATSPLRPTTTGPLVLAGARHAHACQRISGVDCEVVTGAAPILEAVALVDTPDLDSTSTQNRAKAEILIDNADMVVFVTSALRYADLVPWEVLRRASSRGAPVINVINRLGARSAGAVTDFRARLGREGLDPDPVRVPEHHIPPGGHRLPALAALELKRRILAETIAIEDDRREVVDRVIRSTAAQVVDLAADIEALLESAEGDMLEARARFENAARMVDLSSLFAGLGPEDPPPGSLARLVWPWRHRLGEEEWREVASTIEQRLTSIVEGEARRAVAGQGPHGGLPHDVVEDLRSQTSSLVEEWLAKLEHLAASRRLGGRLAALVLAEAAATGHRTPAFDRLFEDGSSIVRAHRSLAGPLEELFHRIGARLAAGDSGRWSHEDTDRLRELAAAVSARSHFADA